MNFLKALRGPGAAAMLSPLFGLWCVAEPVHAQNFPTRTLSVAVTNPPGGPTDWTARAFATELQKRWGQSVVVENRPGGNGLAAINPVRKANPDGHALLLYAPAISLISAFAKGEDVAIPREIQPLTPVSFYPHVAVAPVQLNVRNMKEFVAMVKANPGKFNVASANGGSVLLDNYRFLKTAGLEMQIITYKGGQPQMLTSIITNETQFYFSSALGIDAQAKANKLVILGVAAGQRFPALPNVPTIKEGGVNFEAGVYLGFFTTGGTPRPVVDKIAHELADIAKGDLADQIRKQGFEPATMTPDEWTKFVLDEGVRGREMVQAMGLKPE